MSESNTSSDVIIIGCGISGLSVAYHLLLNNFSGRIIILESRPAIGGRVTSTATKYEGHGIELGANWIHGIMGNPIYELALKHKLIDQLSTTNVAKHIVEARAASGHKVDINIVEEVYKTYFYFIKKCENYFQLEDSDGPLRCNNSVGVHLRADIESWINSLKDDDSHSRELRRSIFNTLLNRETCISGSDSMDEVSLKDFGSYTELPGGNITIPQGFNKVLSCLLNEMNAKLASKAKLGDKDEKQLSILKSHRVIKIKWKDVLNVLNVEEGIPSKTKVEVICDNGSTFSSNHVVVTLPLGVLKKDVNSLFEPKLPQYKLDSINTLGYGVVNKIFLEYNLPLNSFLDENVDEILLLWDSQSSVEPKWFHKIYSISKITNHCLLLWVSGQEAIHLEQLQDEQINQQLTQMLQQFLNNKRFPKADNLIVTRWATDPNSYGSYSFIKSNGSIRDIELLSQPIYANPAHDKPVLVFGGEATHPSFYSTVHGAFLSGRKAAYYLLDVDPDEDKSKTDEAKSWSLGIKMTSNLLSV